MKTKKDLDAKEKRTSLENLEANDGTSSNNGTLDGYNEDSARKKLKAPKIRGKGK